jgi:ATP-dependent Clp protease protease subunit
LILNTLVLEQTEHGEVPVDVYQKLSGDRILFLTDYLDDNLASDIVATLFLKDHEDSESKITLFINTHGGDIRNSLMIYDVMTMIHAPIETVCIGAAMDEAVVLLAGGTPGMRSATPHAVISATQLVHSFHMHTDLPGARAVFEQEKLDNQRLMEILAKTTKKTVAQVKKDFDRRVFFNAKSAMKYGFIDKIVTFNK